MANFAQLFKLQGVAVVRICWLKSTELVQASHDYLKFKLKAKGKIMCTEKMGRRDRKRLTKPCNGLACIRQRNARLEVLRQVRMPTLSQLLTMQSLMPS